MNEQWDSQAGSAASDATVGDDADRRDEPRPTAPLRLVRGHSEPAGDDSDWDTIATFVVEFQRRRNDDNLIHRSLAHHMETDSTAHWQGLAAQQLVQWMLDKLAGHPSHEA